ncbi:MAG TPA: 4-(cytidine 5'-diphospho)-2-C-methyl-D-erythritol kinase [Verrucomicrobiota bacterium]|nr:4-(cytidine 5'-diphospho)-2-C-methyl-D-erythritol kinase [Verrucomicrobiota bacterium]
MKSTCKTHCKINLLLNVVGQRDDGFHELEMLMLPVPIFDRLDFELTGGRIELTCNRDGIPTDSGNLVWRAAELFAAKAGITDGVRIHLEKTIPAEGGLGGGSGNAAATLLALNELHGLALGQAELHALAAELGSDVPFFLQSQPAVARGRGEIIKPVASLAALEGKSLLLVRPGFGVPTPWAYQGLAKFPDEISRPLGRADELAKCLANGSLAEAAAVFSNSLEAPVFDKFPLLKLIKEHALAKGAEAALLCGSGSTIFAICPDAAAAKSLGQSLDAKFGQQSFVHVAKLPGNFTGFKIARANP